MVTAISARPSVRAEFIRKTYQHLAGAVGAFVLLEWAMFATGIAQAIAQFVLGTSWLLILGGFMLLGWLSRSFSARADAPQMQYLGLGLYVVLEAIIFAPLLFLAMYFSDPSVIPTAGILTGLLFAGLTAVAVTTQKDFSFLRGVLTIGFFVAIGLIVCASLFGFSLGLWFSVAMIAFASAAILYDTSKVLHHYRTDQHVAAALELFASVMLLFWYVLQLLMSLNRN